MKRQAFLKAPPFPARDGFNIRLLSMGRRKEFLEVLSARLGSRHSQSLTPSELLFQLLPSLLSHNLKSHQADTIFVPFPTVSSNDA